MRRISFLFVLALALPAVASGAARDVKLSLVAYSTPREAYGKLDPGLPEDGRRQGRHRSPVIRRLRRAEPRRRRGLSADVVAFSLAPDVTSLVQKGLVASSWNKNQWQGMVTRSVVVFVVRDGNPKQIRTWDDLVKPGVQVVTPNPFTSGGARWNVMAAYGAQLRAGKTPKQAVAYLQKLFKHVVAQPRARARRCRRSLPAGATSCSPTRTRRSSRSSRTSPSSS